MKRILTLVSILSLALASAYAQSSYPNLFYSDGSTVYIQSGAVLHVQGDIVNNTGSTIINNGLVNVEGDFRNAATYTTDGSVGEGTTRFIGNSTVAGSATTGVQTISGTTAPTFYNMVIDRSTGGQAISLATNVTVTRALVWGGSTVAGTYYVPTSFSSTLGNTTLMQVRGVTPGGHGLINTYTGTSDYELYLSNPDPASIAGYQSITAFSFTSNTAALTGTANDGYISNRGVDGISVGFARQADRSGTYVFPVGSPNRTYNPMKVYFSGTPSASMKISSKFTEFNLASTNVAFTNSFDKNNSVAPANTMNLAQNPIDYVSNPGFNIFQHSTCSPTAQGNWLILDKVLKAHGYWSLSASPSLAGTSYVVQAYPHGYTEWVTNGTNPNKRVVRTGASGFTGVPAISDFQNDLETSVAPNYSDLLTYSYFSNHKNFTTCNDGDGVTGGRYSSFSHFAIMTSSANTGNTALPVKLIDLTATPIDNSYIRVDWSTASEINNRGFEVERSEDGVNFTRIGWVDGNGTTNQQHDYSYNDKTVQPNTEYYYRLNQVDIDGRSELTNIVSAQIIAGSAITVAELRPNPANASVRVTISTTDAADATIRIYDILGKEILNNAYQLDYGTNTYQLNTESLAAAAYNVVIKVAGQSFTKRLVIVR